MISVQLFLDMFIDDKAKEGLLCQVNAEDSRDNRLCTLLNELLLEVGINLENCVSYSFDGSAMMSGIYSALQVSFKKAGPDTSILSVGNI